MVYILQKQNRYLILLIIFLTILIPIELFGDLARYDPEIDISVSTFSYSFKKSDNIANFKTGLYFGGYLSLKSPIFFNNFNAKNIYNTIELGTAFNRIDNSSSYILSFPLFIDFSYRIPIFKRLFFYPFLGFGFNFLFYPDGGDNFKHIDTFINSGIELKYLIWKKTFIKSRLDWGIFFDNSIKSGIGYFLRIRIPFIFLP